MDTRKLISYLGAALAVACILFAPVVGCGDMSLNGLQIIQDKSVEADIKLFIIIAIICGIIIFILKKPLHFIASAISGAIALLIAYLIAHSKNAGIELRFGAILAFIGYAITAVTNFFGMANEHEVAQNKLVNTSLPLDSSAPKQDILPQQQITAQQLSQIMVGIREWTNKNVKIFIEWIGKNKKIVLPIAGSLILLYGVYYFFIKNDPVSDAKKAALAYCDCSTKYNDAMINVYEDFLKSFNSYNFKKRQDSRNKLMELQNSANADNSVCSNFAQQKYNDLRNRYISDAELLNKFDVAYNSFSRVCNPSNQSKMSSLYSEIESKIVAISDPEPDIEKIKTDLIGQKIPGWNFDYLSEIKNITIANTTRSSSRIEYLINLHMVGYTTTDDYYNDAQVIVTYIMGNDTWYFNDIKEIYITYENKIPSDSWATLIPLQNCRFNFPDDHKLFWRVDSWGPDIKTGPDARNVTLPSSNSYFVKSRESHPVQVKITYRPNY